MPHKRKWACMGYAPLGAVCVGLKGQTPGILADEPKCLNQPEVV